MSEDTEFFEGSGNVFADIGLPNPDEHLAKASLVHKIITVMRERGLTSLQTAELLDVGHPEFSDMIHGRFEDISVGDLLRHLLALGQDVQIVVKAVPPDATRPPALRVA